MALPKMWPFKKDEKIAAKLPALRLPPMEPQAREAFRKVLRYERPETNGPVADILGLAEARGFSAHPSDWIPSWDNDPRFPALYQPWVDWLAEKGHTPYHPSIRLTEQNWPFWKPAVRLLAFEMLLMRDRPAAHQLMMDVVRDQSSSVRYAFLSAFRANGVFDGNLPADLPILRLFTSDRAKKVRTLAEDKIAKMNGLQTEEDHAQDLAREFKVVGERIELASPDTARVNLLIPFACTTFDCLAEALGLSPVDLARFWDFKLHQTDFFSMVTRTADPAIRQIIAERAYADEVAVPHDLYAGLPDHVRDQGRSMAFASPYPSAVIDFLGSGHLHASEIEAWHPFLRLERSVIDELKDGSLPVNKRYDPLRILGLAVKSSVAAELREKALSFGMPPSNPRLTMLNFNIALG